MTAAPLRRCAVLGRAVATLAAIVGLVTSCSGNSGGGHAPAASPGTVQVAWRVLGRPGTSVDDTAYDPQRKVIYYVSGGADPVETVTAEDVVNGALRWQASFRTGEGVDANDIVSLLPYKNYLVVVPHTEVMLSGTFAQVDILDATTGGTVSFVEIGPNAVVAGVSGGNLIVSEDTSLLNSDPSAASPKIIAYSLATGSQVWERRPGCSNLDAADDSLLLATCGSDVVGLSPDAKHTLWRYHLTATRMVYLHDRVIEALTGTSVTFLDEQGRKIAGMPVSREHAGQSPVYFAVSNGSLIFAGQNEKDRLQVTTADLSTDKIRKRFVMPGGIWPVGITNGVSPYFPAGEDLAPGAVYLPVALPSMFAGGGLLALNTSDGSGVIRTEPALTASREAGDDETGGSIVAVSAGRVAMLIAPTSADHDGLTGYVAIPPAGDPASARAPALLGVPRHWPDACWLLPPADRAILASRLGARYHRTRTEQPAGPGLPAASTCSYVTAAATTASVTVTVAWDADSAGDAKAVLNAADGPSVFGGKAIPGPWDVAYDIHSEFIKDGIALSAGPLVIEVTDTLHNVARPFARNLATWLRSKRGSHSR